MNGLLRVGIVVGIIRDLCIIVGFALLLLVAGQVVSAIGQAGQPPPAVQPTPTCADPYGEDQPGTGCPTPR